MISLSRFVSSIALALALALASSAWLDAQFPAAASRTKVVLLGTGTPNANPDRSGPSLAVVVDEQPYLVDFGPGVVRRAAAAARDKGITGLQVRRLNRAFATHLHSDHTLGLPDLIFSPWVLERKDVLQLFGPAGTKQMADHISRAWAEDVEIRLNGGEPSNKTGYRVEAHDVKPGEVYKDDKVRVTAFAVPHGSWKQAFGYRFDTPDRRIVISGDTGPSPDIAAQCGGCDVLVHEVYSVAGFAKREPEWQRYHARYHTSSHELAKIAQQARPGVLVLYHQLLWGATEEALVEEIRTIYKGKVVSGKDLDVF